MTKVIHEDWHLLNEWRRKLLQGELIEAFINATLAPLALEQVIRKIDYLVRNECLALHHLSGVADVSYVDFAKNLAEELGVSTDRIQAVSVEPRSRRSYTTLS